MHNTKSKDSVSLICSPYDSMIHSNYLSSICFCKHLSTPDYDYVLTGGRDRMIFQWKIPHPEPSLGSQNPSLVGSYIDHTDWVTGLCLLVASCSNDCSVKVWKLSPPRTVSKPIQTFTCATDYINALFCLGHAPTGDTLFAGSSDGTISVIDLPTGTIKNTIRPMEGKHTILTVSSNAQGYLLAVGMDHPDMKLYDLREKDTPELSLKGHEDAIRTLKISKQGYVCLSGSADGTVRMWDLRYQQAIATYDMHAGSSVRQLIPFHRFSKFLSADLDGNVYISSVLPGINTKLVEKEGGLLALDINNRKDFLYMSFAKGIPSLYGEPVDPNNTSAWEILNLGRPRALAPRTHLQPLKIEGTPPIKNYKLLKDARHLLCETLDSRIHLLDLITMNKFPTEEGKTLQELTESLNSTIGGEKSAESWCKIDVHLGSVLLRLTESNWLKSKGPIKSIFASGEPDNSTINYGEHLTKGIFNKSIEGRCRWDIKLLEACESREYLEELEKYLKTLQETTRPVAEAVSKYTVSIYIEGKGKTQAICANTEILKDSVPNWITQYLYKSPFPSDDIKLKFTIEPVKLTEKEEEVLGKAELKSYTITCYANVLIKDVADLAKKELIKISRKITDIILGVEGKVLHPMTPLGLAFGKRKSSNTMKLSLQYKIML